MKKIALTIAAFMLMPTTASFAQGYSGSFGSYGSNKTMQYQSRIDEQSAQQAEGTNEAKRAVGKLKVNYNNFSIEKTPSGKVTCGITFNLTNESEAILRSLSLELQWSAMKTSISFKNIASDASGKINYRLMGEGCYTISGAPEITVKACRLQNYTDDECADKIEWK